MKTKNIICTSIIGVSIATSIVIGSVVKGDSPTQEAAAPLSNIINMNTSAAVSNNATTPSAYSLTYESEDSTYVNGGSDFELDSTGLDSEYYGELIDEIDSQTNTYIDYCIPTIVKPEDTANTTAHNIYKSFFIPNDDDTPDLSFPYYRTDKGFVVYQLNSNEADIPISDTLVFNKEFSRFGESFIGDFDKTMYYVPENAYASSNDNEYIELQKSEETINITAILENGYPAKQGSDYDISDAELEWATAIAIKIKNNELSLGYILNNYTVNPEDEDYANKLISVIDTLINLENEDKYLDITLPSTFAPNSWVTNDVVVKTNYKLAEFNPYYPNSARIRTFKFNSCSNGFLIGNSAYILPGTNTFNLAADFSAIKVGNIDGYNATKYNSNDPVDQLIISAYRYSEDIYNDSDNNSFIVVQPKSDVSVIDLPGYDELTENTYFCTLNFNFEGDNPDSIDTNPLNVFMKPKVENGLIRLSTGGLADNSIKLVGINAGVYNAFFSNPVYKTNPDGTYDWYDVSEISFEVKPTDDYDYIYPVTSYAYSYIKEQDIDIDIEFTHSKIHITDELGNPVSNHKFYLGTVSKDNTDKYNIPVEVITDENGDIEISGYNPYMPCIYLLSGDVEESKMVVYEIKNEEFGSDINIIFNNTQSYPYISIYE